MRPRANTQRWLRHALDRTLAYSTETALDCAGDVLDNQTSLTGSERRMLLNFFDSFLRLDSTDYKALSFPPGFFETIVNHLALEEPGLMAAIAAWDSEWSLIERPPASDGLLGTACREVARLASVLEGRS